MSNTEIGEINDVFPGNKEESGEYITGGINQIENGVNYARVISESQETGSGNGKP